MPEVAPYGAWVSPITPEALVEQTVRLSNGEVDGERVIWSESRPAEAGRQVLVSGDDLLRPPLSARTLVHEFEARYFDRLVGPYPEALEEYRRRSPLHAADRINCPVIFFQGLDDVIVPPSQSEALVEALQRRGIQVAYLTFAGEQHGFRQASTIVRVAEAELSFYGDVLGFS